MDDIKRRLEAAEARADALITAREQTKNAHAAAQAVHRTTMDQLGNLLTRTREAIRETQPQLCAAEARREDWLIRNRALLELANPASRALVEGDRSLSLQLAELANAKAERVLAMEAARRASMVDITEKGLETLRRLEVEMTRQREEEKDVRSTLTLLRSSTEAVEQRSAALLAQRAELAKKQTAADAHLRELRERLDFAAATVDVLRRDVQDAPRLDERLCEHSRLLATLQGRLYDLRTSRSRLVAGSRAAAVPTAAQVRQQAVAAEAGTAHAASTFAAHREALQRELEAVATRANAVQRRLDHEVQLARHLSAHEGLRMKEVLLARSRVL
jgi:hypothetical protein